MSIGLITSACVLVNHQVQQVLHALQVNSLALAVAYGGVGLALAHVDVPEAVGYFS